MTKTCFPCVVSGCKDDTMPMSVSKRYHVFVCPGHFDAFLQSQVGRRLLERTPTVSFSEVVIALERWAKGESPVLALVPRLF